jgi:hypothetical protein
LISITAILLAQRQTVNIDCQYIVDHVADIVTECKQYFIVRQIGLTPREKTSKKTLLQELYQFAFVHNKLQRTDYLKQ